MPVCTVKGIEINYIEEGEKNKANRDRTIIFIHGAGGNAERWMYQVNENSDYLNKNNYAVALDLPGHGQSGGEACGQVFLYREWVKEFIDALGIDGEELIIAGHSMGGAIAMDFSLKYPDLVKGLIIVGSAARFNVPQERLEAYKRGEYTWEWAKVGFASGTPNHLVDKLFEENQNIDPWSRYLDFLACARYRGDNLDRIDPATLIICGTEDKNTPPELSRHLASNIKYSKLIMVDDAAHQVMLEQPKKVNQAMANYLENL